jgi:DNA-directed RNA polymerase alpha subunit
MMGADATDLPKLAAPARRALLAAGYTSLKDFTEVTEPEVMKLHGMGPNALRALRQALEERGLSFRSS